MQPDDRGHQRNADDNRNENAGNLVGDFGDGRFGCGCIADHADDLRQRGIFTDARRLTVQKAGLVDRGRRNGVARRFCPPGCSRRSKRIR